MKSIPPSQQIRQQIHAIMDGGWEDEEDLVTQLGQLRA